jgi:hypothetical protein
MSDIISWVGACTGTIALAIKLYETSQARPQLRIYQQSNEPNFYFSAKNMQNFSYPNEALLGIRLDNVSNVPISIAEFRLELPGYSIISDRHAGTTEEYKLLSISDAINKNKNFIGCIDQILSPFIISPYSLCIGIVRFPAFPEMQTQTVEANFVVVTPHKEYTSQVLLLKACSLS